MLKVYVAARIEDRPQAEEFARLLEAAGATVTSRWIEMERKERILDYSAELPETLRRMFADLDDTTNADVLALWKPKTSHRNTTGGHHVETGWSLCLGKPVFLIGSRENIFHWHPFVREVDTAEEAVHGIMALEDKDWPVSAHAIDSYQRWTRLMAIYVDHGRRTSRAATYLTVGGGGEAGEVVDKVLGHLRSESDRLLSRTDLTEQQAKELDNLTVVIGALHSFAYAAKRLEELKRPLRDGSMPLPEMAPFPPELVAAIALELGDSSWYFPCRLADELGIPASRILAGNVEKLRSRKERGVLHGTGDNR